MSHTDLHIDLTAVGESETEFEFVLGLYEGNEPVKEKRMWIDRESALETAQILEDYLDSGDVHADAEILFAVEEETGLYGLLIMHIDREYGIHRLTLDSPEYDGEPELFYLSDRETEVLAGWLKDPLGYGTLIADCGEE